MNFLATTFSGIIGGVVSMFGSKISYDGHIFQTEQIRVTKTVDIGLQYVEIINDVSPFALKYNDALKVLIDPKIIDEITNVDFLKDKEFSPEEARSILSDKEVGFSLEDIYIYSEQIQFVMFLNELEKFGLINDIKEFNLKEVDYKGITDKVLIDNKVEAERFLYDFYERLRHDSDRFNVALNKMECLNLIPLMKVSKEKELYNLLNNIFLDEISTLYYHISYCRQSEERPSFENTVGVYEEFCRIYEERKSTLANAEELAKAEKLKLKQKSRVKK